MLRKNFNIKNYQQKLLSWYDSFGRHNLPWQDNFSNTYYVWLSEIMLQQTRVNTVIPYFEKFIYTLPTIKSVAHSSQENVMYLWSGLGYYSRALNFHKAAKIILDKYDGVFPNRFSEIINLPGIGKSTAHAILSISFSKPYPIMDGNVKRVFSRLF